MWVSGLPAQRWRQPVLMRSNRAQVICVALLLGSVVTTVSTASARDAKTSAEGVSRAGATTTAAHESTDSPIPVGVYLPSVFFTDLATKAAFLSEIESALQHALNQPVVAAFRAHPERMQQDAIWLVEAAEAAGRNHLTCIQRAKGPHGVSPTVSVYARRAWSNAYKLLSTGSLVLPGGGGRERDFLRFWLLLDEPKADLVARNVHTVRDANAALAVVAAGEKDGAIVVDAPYADLEPRFAALKKLTWLRAAPLPVMAINRTALAPDRVAPWTQSLLAAKLPSVKGIIERWIPADMADELTLVSRTLSRRRSAVDRSLVLAPLENLAIPLAELLPAAPTTKPLSPVLVMPKQRFPGLPDPPLQAVAAPRVSRADTDMQTRAVGVPE